MNRFRNELSAFLEALRRSNFHIDPPPTQRTEYGTALLEAVSWASFDSVEQLIEDGADVDFVDSSGCWTPLLKAITGGEFEIAKLLIERGADLNLADIYGRTPLLEAIYLGHIGIATLLIQSGAKTDRTDNLGRTPLLEALHRRQTTIAKLLIERGADIERTNNVGQSPASIASQIAVDAGNSELLDMIEQRRLLRKHTTVKLCVQKLKRLGMVEVVLAKPVNELSESLFVFMVLEDMMSRKMYGLAENVVSFVR